MGTLTHRADRNMRLLTTSDRQIQHSQMSVLQLSWHGNEGDLSNHSHKDLAFNGQTGGVDSKHKPDVTSASRCDFAARDDHHQHGLPVDDSSQKQCSQRPPKLTY
jgi:hypothetical protein